MIKYGYIILFYLLLNPGFCNTGFANEYYVDKSGNDDANGSFKYPFKSINKINSIKLNAGDIVFFKSNEIFNGSIILDSLKQGAINNPIMITSYGKGIATINGKNSSAILLNQTKNINIKNLRLVGAGRKMGNTTNGISINHCNSIFINNLDISGFQKAGLLILSSTKINIRKVYAHENGFAGISVEGSYKTTDCNHIIITNCIAENNPGDPTNLNNHSGNGIVAGYCSKITIEYCVANNNGWDMPRTGNGPVGIWCFEADSVIIQHCISYRNKTAKGADDGGGFDLDGGVSNSVIQYCLSYENQGSGFGIFQCKGANKWHDNVIRFNISENDGAVSAAHAAAYIWNSSDDKNQFYNLLFYNNTIYNKIGPAINYAANTARKGFAFYNNIFVAKDGLVNGKMDNDIFLGNDWWGLSKPFNMDGIFDFKYWAKQNNKEIKDGKLIGLNIDPNFYKPNQTAVKTTRLLKSCNGYEIPTHSLLKNKGIDLNKLLGIKTPRFDFNQCIAPINGIGASFN